MKRNRPSFFGAAPSPSLQAQPHNNIDTAIKTLFTPTTASGPAPGGGVYTQHPPSLPIVAAATLAGQGPGLSVSTGTGLVPTGGGVPMTQPRPAFGSNPHPHPTLPPESSGKGPESNGGRTNSNFSTDENESADDREATALLLLPDAALTSYLYDWSRKLFRIPQAGYEPYSDPLSAEGRSRLHRDL